jgi:hypothetical protein
VARLSKKAQESWGRQLNLIEEIRVVAMVKRYKSRLKNSDFAQKCQGESWEVPLVELVLGPRKK